MAHSLFTDKHPMKQKVDRLMELLHEMNITLDVLADEIYVHDNTGFYPTTRMVDAESKNRITMLPATFEYALLHREDSPFSKLDA